MDGDGSWERIVRDSSKRGTLSAALDELNAEFARDPGQFRVMQTGDFEQAQ